jgi:hypothetical protein
MRPPNQPGLPVMPDAADVLEAIRRLELTGPQESDDLGPSVEAGVSGRTVSAGGPLVSPPLKELGLLLDDDLVDNLMMLDGPHVSIPVEMALDAIAKPMDDQEAATDAGVTADRVDAGAGDTLHGARWRLRSWSGREDHRESRELTATLVPPPPAFLTEWPIRPRMRRTSSRFDWDLLGDTVGPRREGAYRFSGNTEDPAADDLAATAAEPNGAAAAGTLPPSAGSWWTSAGADRLSERRATALWTAGIGSQDRPEHDAERAIAEARRSPSPVTVALASLVFPGWGQALNDEHRKAAVFRFVYLATLFLAAMLTWRGPIGRLAASLTSVDPGPAFAWLGTAFTTGAGLWLLSIYDALVVRSAQRR